MIDLLSTEAWQHLEKPSDSLRGSKNILIIVDGLNSNWKCFCHASEEPENRYLLTLGLSAEVYRQINASLVEHHRVNLLDISKIARCARENVQKNYPQFIYDLVRKPLLKGRSILDSLAIGKANMWWLMDSSEKSALRCSLVNDLYFLELVALACDLLKPAEIWISVQCQALAESLSSFECRGKTQIRLCRRRRRDLIPRLSLVPKLYYKRLALALYMFLQFIAVRLLPIKMSLDDVRLVLFTVYPVMWRDVFRSKPSDRIYGGLFGTLSQWQSTAYVGIVRLSPLEVWRKRKVIADNLKKLRIVPLGDWVKLTDILSVVSPVYLRKITGTWKSVTNLGPYRWGPFNVVSSILAELKCSFLKNELPFNIVWMRAIRRVCEKYEIDFLLHWGEFQPIEKAIWYGVQGTATKAVAFQHSMSSPMFLNYHFAQDEIRRSLESSEGNNSMPLPSLFASTGRYAVESLKGAGFPEERLRVCGAIRYRELMELAARRNRREETRRKWGLASSEMVILVAVATKPMDNRTMASSLNVVLSTKTQEFTILIKSHPLLEMEQEMASLITGDNPRIRCRCVPKDVPLHELLAGCDVLVTNSSASGVEALALGVTPVFFHNPYLYDVSVLYSLEKLVFLAANTNELDAALTSIFGDASVSTVGGPDWRSALEYVFHGIDTRAEERLLQFLRDAWLRENPLTAVEGQ